MADITKIKVNGTTYNIKDTSAVETVTMNGITQYPVNNDIYLGDLQEELVSGTNIKTINNESLLGPGDINIFDAIYPVGSIYMSVNSTNPSTLFGGTWSQLKDRFLLGAGSTYTAGDTGGSSSQTVNFNNGQANIGFYPNNTGGIYMIQNANTFKATNVAGVSTQWGGSSQSSCKPASLSGTQTLNNMPPYLVVYMWKRTA